MAVSKSGSTALLSQSFGDATPDFTFTIPSGTTLALLAFGFQGDRSITSVENWNTTEAWTQLFEDTISVAGDAAMAVYAILNPTATTDTITITLSGTSAAFWAAMIPLQGTNTDSVAAATNVDDSIENTATTSTTALTGGTGGTAGNALFAFASTLGGDMTPGSNDGGFTELYDGSTGADSGSGDHSYYVAELLDGAPQTLTITWAGAGAPDENIGALIEVVAAAGMPHHYYAAQQGDL